MNGSRQRRSLGITTHRRGRRSMTSYHNEVVAKTCGESGYCTMEDRWKVCDWPKCGKKKKEGCGFLYGYNKEALNENRNNS